MQYFSPIFGFLIISLVLSSCGDRVPAEASIIDATSRSANSSKGRKFMKVTINNLRIRTTPDLEGAVLERLKEKMIVEYRHDSTSFTTPVEMNRKTYHDHWYKVTSDAGNTGWVYGGCVAFLPKQENKRIIALKNDLEARKKQIGARVLGAEGGTATIVQEAPKLDDYQIKRFNMHLQSIQPQQTNALQLAGRYYESMFADQRDATSDAAFAKLLVFYERVVQYWKRNIAAGNYQFFAEEIQRYGSPNMQQDKITRILHNNGITFDLNPEGKVFLKANTDFILRRFYRLVSPPFREYLDQYAIEGEHPAFEDDKVIVPITELAAHTVFWDKYLTKYPFFPFKEELNRKRKEYIATLLCGTTTQPAFDAETKSIQPAFKEAYTVLTKQMGHSPFIQSMTEYWEVLQRNDFQRSNAVIAYQDTILNNL